MTTQKLPLTGLEVGSVRSAVLVCGDPARANRMAERLNNVKSLSNQREYHIYQGIFRQQPVTVASHGIGAPGAAIAFEELIAAGARRLLRVGTCGGIMPHVQTGQLVVATAAVQNTGYGRETVPDGYPAVAHMALTRRLYQTAKAAGVSFETGLVLSRDNFYAGIKTPATPDYEKMAAANVLAVEMECAALFIIGSLRGVETAAILAVDGNVLAAEEQMDTYDPHSNLVSQTVDAAIDIALRTVSAGSNERHE